MKKSSMMKSWLFWAALSVFCLSAAWVRSGYADAEYSPAQSRSLEIAQLAQAAEDQCAKRNSELYQQLVNRLDRDSKILSEADQRQLGRLVAWSAATQIRILMLDFTERQPASETYCHIKLSYVRKASLTASRAAPMPGAYNYCSEDFYALKRQLKAAVGLKSYELVELYVDLAKFSKVNAFACSADQQHQNETFVRQIQKEIPMLL